MFVIIDLALDGSCDRYGDINGLVKRWHLLVWWLARWLARVLVRRCASADLRFRPLPAPCKEGMSFGQW